MTPGAHVMPGTAHAGRVGSASVGVAPLARSVLLMTWMLRPALPVEYAQYTAPTEITSGSGKSMGDTLTPAAAAEPVRVGGAGPGKPVRGAAAAPPPAIGAPIATPSAATRSARPLIPLGAARAATRRIRRRLTGDSAAPTAGGGQPVPS